MAASDNSPWTRLSALPVLIESYEFENSNTCVFSQSIKAMMRTLGLRVGECRLPLGPAPDGTEERAREVYAKLHG